MENWHLHTIKDLRQSTCLYDFCYYNILEVGMLEMRKYSHVLIT